MCQHGNVNNEMIPVTTVWWIVVASVLVTFMISWFLFHHLWFCKRIENTIEFLGYWLQRLWYAILFIGSSIYLFIHFDECRDLTFTPKFNGFNVIFVFWLILLILPLFEKFEGFGVNLKLNRQNKISTDAASMDSTYIMSVEELDQMYREGGNNE